MWQLMGFLLHVLVIYAGAQLTQLPGLDLWRCMGVGCLSYLVLLVFGGFAASLLTLGNPLWIGQLGQVMLNALLLGAATALAARLILSSGWRQALSIGLIVTAANALYSWVAGATPALLPPGCGT